MKIGEAQTQVTEAAGVTSTTGSPDTEPIACTLDGDRMPDRMAEWQALLSRVSTRTAVLGGVRLTFAADASVTEIARLAAAEQECCRFFAFTITLDERGAALEVRAPDDALPVVEALFGAAWPI